VSPQSTINLKGSIFWDITPCSPLEVTQSFGGRYRLHLQDRRKSQGRNQCESRWITEHACFHATWSILISWIWRRYVPPKRRLTFNGLHGVISQKTELFTTTSVRNSNPTNLFIECIIIMVISLQIPTTFWIYGGIISNGYWTWIEFTALNIYKYIKLST
jgi:hypothetical protein